MLSGNFDGLLAHVSPGMFLLVGLVFLLSACGGGGEQVAGTPPVTVEPTQPTPTATATFLPPPTVTPFPTVTPRAASDDAEEGAAIAEAPAPTATGEAGAVVEATEPSPAAGTATPAPEPENSPRPASDASDEGLPGVSQDRMIFAADFYQGWPSVDQATVKIRLEAGRYVFEVGPYDAGLINTTAVNQQDMYVRVEVTPEVCPAGGGYGLLYRFTDTDNYYLLMVSCENRYSVVARVNGAFVGGTLIEGELPSGLDAASQQVHALGLLVQADRHTLYFDDQLLGSFEDAQLGQGDVALYAVSQGSEVLRVAFDNLEVWTVR